MAAGITTLMTLPPEMAEEIIFLTGMRDLGHLAQTCTRMRGIANAFKQTAAFTARKAELQEQCRALKLARYFVCDDTQRQQRSKREEDKAKSQLMTMGQYAPPEVRGDIDALLAFRFNGEDLREQQEVARARIEVHKLNIVTLGNSEKDFAAQSKRCAEIANRPFNRT